MLLKNLNPEQIAAVKATEGTVRIIAGAGSGKTRTLAHRYVYIMNELGIDPANILCLTFTNKAAQEMKKRIAALTGNNSSNDYICTIHSFCVKFLRKEIFRLGYPKTFQVLDEEDIHDIAKEVMAENNIERSQSTVNQLIKQFEKCKFIGPDGNIAYIKQYLLPTSIITDDDKKDIGTQILLKQRKNFALDFKDLILFTIYILQEFPSVKETWQKEMMYIMVDEVQDCSMLEWNLFTTLSAYHGNLFIVGDPDQSIYEWRGANPSTFVYYKPDHDIVMAQNYRSTSHILDAANSVIANNKMRIPKDLFTKQDAGDTIIHYHAKTEQDEANNIASRITSLVKGGSTYSDIAILYRSAYLSRSIEQALMKCSIPYTIWGGIRFFERKEIKDAISYLRLVALGDDISFTRIINVPSRKIGEKTFKNITQLAEQNHTSLYDALKVGHSTGIFKKDSIKAFIELIEKARNAIHEESISEILNLILEESGLLKMYREDGEEERLENIKELLESICEYERDHKEDDVDIFSYLQDIALYTNADYKEDKDKVKLMTIHQAKGLEFPTVFIAGLSEGIFPNHRAIRERKRNGLEEERRLMYVAITRAEKNLYLTESEGYNVQDGQQKYPSRFIKEIKSNLFVTEGKIDNSLWEKSHILSEYIDREFYSSIEKIKDPTFNVGDTVSHEVFGVGSIEAVIEDYCSVQFNGIKTPRKVRADLLQKYSVNQRSIH